ncbi:tyrosine-type recombinase/integrase [Streptomyces sp. 4503]|uniref:Tyrosine-type recombinase/integrase n=1 Tax=Streptomyces niphimycinicus TaxID=2842201 RepID=A0ABS6CJI2_9ACTN|nr:tyrosine-type recombinase/integrase [Streptomyces niphimycinicus]MBU3867098.1 tyrosine-type recombinase/integrase [Streptomyces niphimycinicus]
MVRSHLDALWLRISAQIVEVAYRQYGEAPKAESARTNWLSLEKRLVELSGLPPVRLHDLRHISAALSLLAKNDIKVVQERLGHSSRQITSDTYTSVLPEMMRTEAESVMAVVPRDVPSGSAPH